MSPLNLLVEFIKLTFFSPGPFTHVSLPSLQVSPLTQMVISSPRLMESCCHPSLSQSPIQLVWNWSFALNTWFLLHVESQPRCMGVEACESQSQRPGEAPDIQAGRHLPSHVTFVCSHHYWQGLFSNWSAHRGHFTSHKGPHELAILCPSSHTPFQSLSYLFIIVHILQSTQSLEQGCLIPTN